VIVAGLSAGQLSRHADIAMYQIKGRGSWQTAKPGAGRAAR